jgi:acyl-CoA thioesterase
MGMKLVSINTGICTLEMIVRPEMLNGFGVAHGAITFALADSAFAFACNTFGKQAVSIHCSIDHLSPILPGTTIRAHAIPENTGKSIATYQVKISDENGKLLASFKGIAFQKLNSWE